MQELDNSVSQVSTESTADVLEVVERLRAIKEKLAEHKAALSDSKLASYDAASPVTQNTRGGTQSLLKTDEIYQLDKICDILEKTGAGGDEYEKVTSLLSRHLTAMLGG
jgi:hypothetical protein